MTTPPLISVVLCAHNPRANHLQATLDGLRAQDIPLDQWELLVIDNASATPLTEKFSVAWHPHGRFIIEASVGLTHARCRGYREAQGQLIIHSDDDNILSPDYLRTALEIYKRYPHIGSFGGQLTPRFDNEPANDLERSFGSERHFTCDRWSNIIDDNRTMPFGAGMCLRQEVVQRYLAETARDPRRLLLGRTGNRFITGEDIDVNYITVQAGYGTGLFAALHLVHLIPLERMQADHVIRYYAGNAYSMVILHYLHFNEVRLPRRSRAARVLYWVQLWFRMSAHARRRELAASRARQNAVRDMQAWGWITR